MIDLAAFSDDQWKVLGEHLRALRYAQGLSVRKLSERAGVDKNSIMRAESGSKVRKATLDVICVALGTTTQRLCSSILQTNEPFRIARQSEIIWSLSMASRLRSIATKNDIKSINEPLVRRQLAESGAERVYNGILPSQIKGGKLVPCLMEVYAASYPVTHPGQEFCYVLRGSVIIKVRDTSAFLEEGDGLTFWGKDEHSYAPHPKVDSRNLPCLVLSIRSE